MKQRTLFAKKPTEKPAEKVAKVTQTNTPRKSTKHERNQSRNYDPIYCLIQRRRLQMLVHSCIYYEFGSSLITDWQFDTWARELAKLQAEHPEVSKEVPWYEEFIGWDGTTGFNLPLRHPWVLSTAERLLKNSKRR